ncbi:nitrite reductase [Dietzia cinnamea]|uniref:nitrite reductase n=1 Tax=Dietzia cinnamea TaxID=321318 RepID=UPI0021A31E70|nr:nitrite reductase [Dietzia cinnamea]MCT1639140.1 nitrite reductase [Dietzia cinnamea]
MSLSEPLRRTRGDLCPGVLRPWPASDGALVRLRVPGGRLSPASLAAVHGVAVRYGDDDNVHLTSRANLQLRALPIGPDGQLPGEVVSAIAATGLLPAPGHELVRNVMVSPLTGLGGLLGGHAGGRTDLRPVTDALDAGLLADPSLGGLPGRFLFVLDDGSGDLIERSCDLGLVALDAESAQLRVGDRWSEVVPLAGAAARLVEIARAFVQARGTGPDAPWHVRELLAQAGASAKADPAATALPPSLVPAVHPDHRLPRPADPLPFGPVPGSAGRIEHIEAPGGVLTPTLIARLTAPGVTELVVTPWRGVLAVHA